MEKRTPCTITVRNRPRSTRPAKTRVYVWPAKETILENLQNRRARPLAQWRKEVLPAVFEHLGLPSALSKAKWSQSAGCACGCSPGFILEEHWGQDVFVQLEAAAPAAVAPVAVAS